MDVVVVAFGNATVSSPAVTPTATPPTPSTPMTAPTASHRLRFMGNLIGRRSRPRTPPTSRRDPYRSRHQSRIAEGAPSNASSRFPAARRGEERGLIGAGATAERPTRSHLYPGRGSNPHPLAGKPF